MGYRQLEQHLKKNGWTHDIALDVCHSFFFFKFYLILYYHALPAVF